MTAEKQHNSRYRVVGEAQPVHSFGAGQDVLTEHGYVFHVVQNGNRPPVAACVVLGEKGFFSPGLYILSERDAVNPVEIIGSWDSPAMQLTLGLYDKTGFFRGCYGFVNKRENYHNGVPLTKEERVIDPNQLRLPI